MQMPMIVRRLSVFAACAVLVAGCRRGDGEGAAGPARIDTTNAQWEDGLSAEQVQDSARALSPEEAARMGLAVDTTIHLEQLESRDTARGGSAQPTPPPSEGGSGGTDTVPPSATLPGGTRTPSGAPAGGTQSGQPPARP
jgi:hypothetical protein